jgi:hypothetical protein
MGCWRVRHTDGHVFALKTDGHGFALKTVGMEVGMDLL